MTDPTITDPTVVDLGAPVDDGTGVMRAPTPPLSLAAPSPATPLPVPTQGAASG